MRRIILRLAATLLAIVCGIGIHAQQSQQITVVKTMYGPDCPLTATNPGISGCTTFTIMNPAPTFLSMSPNTLAQGQTALITLRGTGFTKDMTITGGAVINVLNSSIAGVDFIVQKAHPAKVYDLALTTPYGTSNTLPFLVTPAPPDIPPPGPTSGAVVLDDFENGNRVLNPTFQPPYRDFWYHTVGCNNDPSQPTCNGVLSIAEGIAHDGSRSLRDSITQNNAYWSNRFYPENAANNGWGLLKNFLVSGTWKNDTFNRMRFWIKAPGAQLVEEPPHYYNMNVGTFYRGKTMGDGFVANSNGGAEGGGGGHQYHYYNVPATDVWYQIIVDTHPSHLRGLPGATEYGDRPYPTNEPGWNYFDGMTRFYVDFSSKPLKSFPGDFYMDTVEFFTDHPAANVAQVYSLGGMYDPRNNRLRIGWQHPKNDGVTCHEVRYAFADVFSIGWAAATPAPSGRVCPYDTAYAGMVYDTKLIPAAGPSVFLAIKPEGATGFNQIAIPLGVRP